MTNIDKAALLAAMRNATQSPMAAEQVIARLEAGEFEEAAPAPPPAPAVVDISLPGGPPEELPVEPAPAAVAEPDPAPAPVPAPVPEVASEAPSEG